MKRIKAVKLLGLVSIFALLAYVFALKVRAEVRAPDQWDMKTVVTFYQPVEVPGQVLPAGTYIFTTMDAVDLPQVVRIFNQGQTKVVGTFMTIPAYALNPPTKTVVTFEERPGGRPAAIRTWWYPNDQLGHQFTYH